MKGARCGAWPALVGGSVLAACAAPPVAKPADLTDLGPRIAVHCAGEPFAEYRRDGARPVLWPLYAPGGITVTRAFPFAEVAGEPHDHPAQQSVWFGHGAMNGVDFWGASGQTAGQTAGQTGSQVGGQVVEQELSIDSSHGELRGISSWRSGGREVCRDFHRYGFTWGDGWRAVDVDITLVASEGDLVLGDDGGGTFGLRLRPELALRGEAASGSIRDSEGHRDLDVWGKRARWVAYAGTVKGAQVVVAVFDHPDNHGHPTHWHARDYGLLAANPFALHDFTGSPAGTGALTVPAGGQLRLRYRIWLATGPGQIDRVDAAWQEFAAVR